MIGGGTTTLDRPVVTPSRVEFDRAVEQAADTGTTDYTGWWCIATDPFPCPAPGCDFVANHQTAAHLIVVWPERDDRKLLNCALRCRETGRNPRVVEYETAMGPCISWDKWRQLGGPVHGKPNPAPDGFENLPRL